LLTGVAIADDASDKKRPRPIATVKINVRMASSPGFPGRLQKPPG
jgi:hypothetical protein